MASLSSVVKLDLLKFILHFYHKNSEGKESNMSVLCFNCIKTDPAWQAGCLENL